MKGRSEAEPRSLKAQQSSAATKAAAHYRVTLAALSAARAEHEGIQEEGRFAFGEGIIQCSALPLLEEARATLERAKRAVFQARRAVIEAAWADGRLKDACPLGEAVEALLAEAKGDTL